MSDILDDLDGGGWLVDSIELKSLTEREVLWGTGDDHCYRFVVGPARPNHAAIIIERCMKDSIGMEYWRPVTAKEALEAIMSATEDFRCC